MDGVEGGDFDEEIGGGGEPAVDKLEIAERSEEGCAARILFLPSFAGGKAERGKEAAQPLVGCGAAGRPQKGNALDHELIVAEGAGLAE